MFSGLEFRHLSFFVAVAEECSFTRAAKRLHTSQPALSQGIKQLEDGLTATLFVRGPAGTALSPAGAAFLPFARDLLLRRDEAAQMAAAVHHGRDLPFRFGYSPFVSRGLVREAQSAYSELVPSGSIEQSSDGSAALVKMVSERRLDAALVTLPISDTKLTVQTVCKERYLVCLRADDPLATQTALAKEAVSQALRIFVARAQNPLFSDTLERKLARGGVHARPTNFVATPGDLMFEVQAGHGWGLVRESLRVDQDLVKRPIEGLPLYVKTAFVCHRMQERPVLPLLAYRLAKTCLEMVSTSAPKKPPASVRPSEPTSLKDIA